MRAELFYVHDADSAIPLYFISQAQWEAGLNNVSAAQGNSFSLQQFNGKLGTFCLLYNADGLVEKAYIGTGLGNQGLALAHAALLLPVGCYQPQSLISKEDALYWSLAQYCFDVYKKPEQQPRVLVVNPAEYEALVALAQARFVVRDLINKPTSDLGPKELAAEVEHLAKLYGAEFQQWVGDELLQHNFPAIHAVGRAAGSAPRLASLTWGQEEHPRIVLIGKGVCFDSGGLDIKPAAGMRLMKKDMGGAAHVIALAQWIMQRQLPVHLQVLIPAVENAVGPNAFRPGDVLTMRNGLTVEIENTDAEGRLILADALVKACEEKPDLIIDFATLTGAARAAVGTEIAALFTNRDSLASAIMDAGQKVSDPLWRLPLFPAYEELLYSPIADMTNASAAPFAGAIIAGLFLQRFITQTVPWIHFDVMAWNVSSKPGKPEGGEAMGLYAVIEYLSQVYG